MNAHVVQLAEQDFNAQVREAAGITVVDFWAPWCGPCRALGPVFDAVASRFAGSVRFAKVNVDEQGALAQEFGVRSIPTLIVFAHGVELARLAERSEPALVTAIQRIAEART